MSGCCRWSWGLVGLTHHRCPDPLREVLVRHHYRGPLEVYYRIPSFPKDPQTRPSHPKSTPLPIGFSRGRSWELLRGAFEMYGVIWFAENQ